MGYPARGWLLTGQSPAVNTSPNTIPRPGVRAVPESDSLLSAAAFPLPQEEPPMKKKRTESSGTWAGRWASLWNKVGMRGVGSTWTSGYQGLAHREGGLAGPGRSHSSLQSFVRRSSCSSCI